MTQVDWRPPLGDVGTEEQLARVLADPRHAAANATAVDRMLTAGAELVDVRPASEALGLGRGEFLHAGPPIGWDRASGPLRGALIGAMLLEGLADTAEEAESALETGDGVSLDPCHHHRTVGPMAGVVSPSMWMFELRDPVHGGTAWCSLNEGLGKVLRYGAYGPEVVERLRWMSDVLGPLLQAAVRARGEANPLDVKAIAAQMLQMGDEGHNRNRAGTLMFLRDLLPDLDRARARPPPTSPRPCGSSAATTTSSSTSGCPPASWPATPRATCRARSLVVAMARNGTDFGIQVSGTGDRWFTGPADTPEGLFLGAFGPEDANPDIGDSAITETAGIGGFAMAAAPAIVKFVGGEVADAIEATRLMYEITLAENPTYQVPVLGFRGTPTGIDATLVTRTGILPHINTGMAGKVAGTGQVGAGLVNPPAGIFPAAVAALAELAPPLG